MDGLQNCIAVIMKFINYVHLCAMRALYRSMRGTPMSWPRMSLSAASEAPSDTAAAATHDIVIVLATPQGLIS